MRALKQRREQQRLKGEITQSPNWLTRATSEHMRTPSRARERTMRKEDKKRVKVRGGESKRHKQTL